MPISSIFKKKKRYGVAEKQRTKEEIDQEYSHHAMMYGHAVRIMSEHQTTLDHHLVLMQKLAAEAAKLPKEEPAPVVVEDKKDEPTPA